MPKPIVQFVRWIDWINYRIGRAAMYLVLAMMGLLLLASISRSGFGVSFIWVVEMAQFLLAAYYLLGGGYSMQLDAHVRMDLLYSRWSPRRRAIVDAVTVWFLMFYLVFLLVGGISSTEYAIVYDQKNYSSWAPRMAPIKIIMCIGIFLMLMQVLATFFRNLADALGKPLEKPIGEPEEGAQP